MLLGAHVSIAGGLRNAPARAAEIDATAIQIFTKQANRWADPVLDPEEVAAFRVGLADAGVGFVCAHDSYLINLATPDPVLRDRSYASFRAELERCRTLGLDATQAAALRLDQHHSVGRLHAVDALIRRASELVKPDHLPCAR